MSPDLLMERLFELLISGDRAGAAQLVQRARSAGVSLDALSHGAYLPLIKMVNALHRAEQLTELAHSCATQILGTLVDEAQRDHDETPRPVRRSPRKAGEAPAAHQRFAVGRLTPDHAAADDDSSSSTGSAPRQRSQFVSFALREGVLTARLAGPHVDEREAPIISTEIRDVLRALGPRTCRLVLDLSDVQVMSSMALGMLLDLRAHAQSCGVKIMATGMTGEMARVLRRLKLADRARPNRMAGILKGAFAA